MVSKFTKISAATMLALGTSCAAMADDSRFIIQVDNGHKGIVKALARQMGGDIKVDANGFIAASFTGKSLDQVKGLLNNPHIQLIEEDFRRVPLSLYNDDAGNPADQQITPYAIYQSQANQLNLQLNSAKTVCIIDSGIARDTGETGGYNPDFDWSNITGSSDSGTNDWFRDGGPHGTHVAGTIAAADNGFGVKGMAPGNPLHIVKVFNEAGWGYSSDLAKAASECSAAGAKIISMSLGGGGANNTEENAFNAFTSNGGLVVAAAGNDGNNTRSYPAGYSSVMMVGAIDADNNIADFSQYPPITKRVRGKTVSDETTGVEVTAGGVGILSTYPGGSATVPSLNIANNDIASSAMENLGTATGLTYTMGTAEAVTAGEAAGKICVIDRGNISFQEKVANCETAGGIGAIVINNEAGMLYGTLGDPNNTSIPAVGVALEDRAAIYQDGLNANISVVPGDYGYMDGTSMATPGVSGVAALLWSNHPSCSGTEIRQALKVTADDHPNGDQTRRDDHFGYGIVKAAAASAYLDSHACTGDTGGGNGGGDPKPCHGKKCN